MMNGILCRCRTTALSFNAIRCRSKSIGSLQNCRNISTATADLFSYSNIDKSKNETSENQPGSSLTTEDNKDHVNSSTLKSPGMMNGILCKCRTTALSFNAIRCRSKIIGSLQNCRNISTATADLFSYSNIDKSKNETSENQPDSLTTENHKDDVNSSTPKSPVWSRFTTKKYDRFAESTTHIVYDFHEEQKRLEEGLDILEKEKVKVQEEIHIERGVRGVFDVEELVDLLREDNAQDIAVIQIPDRMNYVEHMVIASCKSKRHMSSMAEIVRRIYKKKKHTSDRSCIMEGKNTGWVALDMGNIALHLMDPELREDYDLETLWTVGAEFDDQCQKEKESDPLDLINFDIRQGARVLEMPTSAEISPNNSSV